MTDARIAVHDVPTTLGDARVRIHRPHPSTGLLVLGHGAGGSRGVDTVDLAAVTDAANSAGWTVALVQQPWSVGGRRVAPAAPRLDQAWTQILHTVRGGRGVLAAVSGPVVFGGRSAGARVACRTATSWRVDGLLLLSFPLHPPGRPEKLRAPELQLPLESGVPVAAIQGRRDPFGTPQELARYLDDVVEVPGTHSFPASAAPAIAAAAHGILTAFRGASARNEPARRRR